MEPDVGLDQHWIGEQRNQASEIAGCIKSIWLVSAYFAHRARVPRLDKGSRGRQGREGRAERGRENPQKPQAGMVGRWLAEKAGNVQGKTKRSREEDA